MTNYQLIMNYRSEEQLLDLRFFKNHPEFSVFVSKYHNEVERYCNEEDYSPEVA